MNLTNWRIFWISLVALIILLTPLWIYIVHFGGNYVSSEPDKWGPFGDFIGGILNPIISLLTLVATIIVAVVLKRIDDRQRLEDRAASYQPQLVVEQLTFYTYIGTRYAGRKTVEFSRTSRGFAYNSNLQLPNKFGLDIYNIGLGAAKNVVLKYEIDATQISQLIAQRSNIFAAENIIRIIHQARPVAGLVRFEYPVAWNIGPFQLIELHKPVTVSHILNVNVSTSSFFLELPQYLLESYTIFQYVWFAQMQLDANVLPEFVPFYLTVDYTDIGGKPITKKFKLLLKAVEGGHAEFTNILEVEEING